MAYNVNLFNGLIAATSESLDTLTADQFSAIQQRLQGYFTQVVNRHDANAGAHGTRFGAAAVRWITGPATIAPNELLIYLLPFGYTVATSGRLSAGNPPSGHDGLTNPMAGGVASEVYLHFSDPAIIANLMFHEAMHNKLGLDNRMHARGGLAASPITADSVLTPGNIQEMAGALEARRPQWTAGIGLLVAESQRSEDDPLRGLL